MGQANLTRDEAAERAALIDDVAYDVTLDLTGGGATFPATTTVRFTARPGARTFLDCEAAEVRSLTVNGQARPVEAYDGTRLWLEDLAADNEVVVEADAAYQRSGVGL
ncbi:MAG: aminopeptidase N, partial [Actinomycetota bacterium]